MKPAGQARTVAALPTTGQRPDSRQKAVASQQSTVVGDRRGELAIIVPPAAVSSSVNAGRPAVQDSVSVSGAEARSRHVPPSAARAAAQSRPATRSA